MVPTSLVLPELLELPPNCPMTCKTLQPKQQTCKLMVSLGILFLQGPPLCGGIWESGIRRMKEELRKTLHHFTPTAAELHHLLITAEAVLNSRPLLPISLEAADGAQVITPGHFLIGRPIRAHLQDIPPPKDGLRKVRWSLLRAETEQLWKRWHTAYVQSLQSSQKWTRPQPNISVGNIVLLKDDSLKLHSWPLAKVTDVSPGPDVVVRVVTLSRWRSHLYQARSTPRPSDESLRLLTMPRGGECLRSKGWIWRLPQQQPWSEHLFTSLSELVVKGQRCRLVKIVLLLLREW